MPLNLNDLLKKAEKKGIVQQNTSSSPAQLLRPWQQESVLYASDDKKLETIPAAEEINLRQIQDKLKTNLRQTKDKLKSQLETELETKIGRENLRHTWDKLKTSKLLAKVCGLQRNILLFIYDECQSVLDSETAPLAIEYVSNAVKSTISSVRKTIQRMIVKNILIRADHKDGRGGWTIYRLPEDIYQEINNLKSKNKLETNKRQTEDKVKTQLRTELETSAPSSSSSNLIKTTTTSELADEWNFDITSYARFGFTTSQIKQLVSLGVISATDVEQSLIEFSHDFDNNALPPIKTTKINFLMGLLRAGHTYVSEGFKNEQEAMILEMARTSRG